MTTASEDRRIRPDRRRTERRDGENLAGGHLFGIADLARHLGVTERFVRRLIAERRLTYCKIGKFVRFHPDDVEDWINRNRIQAHESEQR
ncbi:MAG: helix-turn-helix domain-containing protein [Actinomycetia bacterium]|nr:helix-turn-helix domain-containing protein [Actinomycetes bacterium]